MVDQIGSGNIRAILKAKPLGERNAKRGKKEREKPEEDPPEKDRENTHLGLNIDEKC